MDCSHAQRYFSAHFEGELEGEKYRQFVNHLQNCSRCTKEYEIFTTSLEVVDELAEVQAPLFFEKRIRALSEKLFGERRHVGSFLKDRLSEFAIFLLRPRGVTIFFVIFLTAITLTLVSQIGDQGLKPNPELADLSQPRMYDPLPTSQNEVDQLNEELMRLIDERESRGDRDGYLEQREKYRNFESLFVTESIGTDGGILSGRSIAPVSDGAKQTNHPQWILFHDFVIDTARIRPVPTLINF